jgi:hypothetical protein
MFLKLKHLILKSFGYFFWYLPFFSLVMTYTFVHRHFFSVDHGSNTLMPDSADIRYIGDLLYDNPIPSHREMAAKWYLRASEAGDTESEFLLGKMLVFGEGIPVDHNSGMKWIQKAANAGNNEAQNFLDNCIEQDASIRTSCSTTPY